MKAASHPLLLPPSVYTLIARCLRHRANISSFPGAAKLFREYPRQGKHFLSFARVYEERKKKNGVNEGKRTLKLRAARLTPRSSHRRTPMDRIVHEAILMSRNWLTRISLLFALLSNEKVFVHSRYRRRLSCIVPIEI